MSEQQLVLIPEVMDAEFALGEPVSPNNGNGRPVGARARKHRYLEALARDHMVSLLETVLRAAQSGDMIACKIIFDRMWPRPRTAAVTVDDLLPTDRAPSPADLRRAMSDTFAKVTHGEITAEDGAHVVSILNTMLKAQAVHTIEAPEAAEEQDDPREQLLERLNRLAEIESAVHEAMDRVEGEAQ